MEEFIQRSNQILREGAKGVEIEMRHRGELPPSCTAELHRAQSELSKDIVVSGPQDEYSVSALGRDGHVLRKIIGPNPGAGATGKHICKRLARVDGKDVVHFEKFRDGCDIKWACSIETPFESKGAATVGIVWSDVRLRYRRSIVVNLSGLHWSIDVTLVRTVKYSEYSKNQDAYKRNFMADAKGNATSCEIEAELIVDERADAPILTVTTLAQVMALICPVITTIAEQHPSDMRDSRDSRDARDLMSRIARHLELTGQRNWTLKNMLNNAQSFTRAEYVRKLFPLTNFFATDKADGERGLALLDDKGGVVVVRELGESGPVSSDFAISTIYDGEVIVRDGATTFYAFDCLRKNGRNVTERDFVARYAFIESFARENVRIVAKEFLRIQNAQVAEVVNKIWSQKRPYSIDGIIFTSADKSYWKTENFKWKPPEANTIDFLCYQCPDNIRGNPPYATPDGPRALGDFRVYLLFCGASAAQASSLCIERLRFHSKIVRPDMVDSVIHFKCPFDPLAYILKVRTADLAPFGGNIDGKVIEMRANTTKMREEPWRKWDLVRERPDRAIGNNIRTAISVFANIIDPLTLEQLGNPSSGYFERDDVEGRYFASRKYRRKITSNVIESLMKGQPGMAVLDVAGGRAQNFTQFQRGGAKIVVNLDNDSMAIVESVARVENNMRAPGMPKARDDRRCSAPSYIGRVVDVSKLQRDGLQEILADIGLAPHCFALITCTFAFHYFCTSRESVARMFSLFDFALIGDGGRILITVMDGARVFNKLRTSNFAWHSGVNDAKYRINLVDARREKLEEFGQIIEVSVPFSSSLLAEPLCNVEAIARVANESGFVLARVITYDNAEQLRNFVVHPEGVQQMDDEDREYSALFVSLVFERKSK